MTENMTHHASSRVMRHGDALRQVTAQVMTRMTRKTHKAPKPTMTRMTRTPLFDPTRARIRLRDYDEPGATRHASWTGTP